MSAHPKTDAEGVDVTAWVDLSQLNPEEVILLAGQKVVVNAVLRAGDAAGAPITVEYTWIDPDGWGWDGELTLPGHARVEVWR